MTFVFTAEQNELRSAVRSFLADRSPEPEVRRLMDDPEGHDPAVWRRLADELGLCGLTVPEEYGGAGATLVEVGIVLEETGRALACPPYLSSVWLTQSVLVRDADESVKRRWLPELASGRCRGAVALDDPVDPGPGVRASLDGHRWRLDGLAPHVLDGGGADMVLVYAETGSGPSPFVVVASECDSAGLDRRLLDTLDRTRRQAELRFTGCPAEQVMTAEGARASLEHARRLAAVGLAVESVGGAQRCLDMAVAYAKVRHQFGRPIGGFQAIKHKCADVLVGVESARSAAYAALWAMADDDPELPVLASLAKSYCTQAFLRAAAANIQVHGGIGFTWEHPAHLYLRRAKSSQLMFGDPVHHRHQFAELLGLWPSEPAPDRRTVT